MNISVERPYAFYGLLILIPVVLYIAFKCKKMIHSLTSTGAIHRYADFSNAIRLRFILRTVFRCAAWIFLVCGYAGISWGTNMVPVQKSGSAVSFVFDISYSMEARDAPGGMTRLDSAANYADELLTQMNGVSVSVVLAKGNGIVAVPLTEDNEGAQSVINSLSPHLLTAEGTSLGSGIEAAINSFPQQSAQAAHIWLFTDGDETDNSLNASLADAIKYGIPVTIIGFGSERESEITTGDGKTVVKTALRAEQMKKIASTAGKKNIHSKKQSLLIKPVAYIDASEVGSAYKLLHSLQGEIDTLHPTPENKSTVVYEIQNVNRKQMFILFAIISFFISIICGEFTIVRLHRNERGAAALSIFLCTLLFTGCSGRFGDGTKILEGKFEWNRKNYQQAVADFLEAAESAHARGDKEYEEYAVYGLASTYLMQDEIDAALERFDEIEPSASDSIRFAVYYNSGIIAHQKGDFRQAASCFKDALRVDSTNTNAKINLELSLMQDSVQSKSNEQQLNPVAENNEEQSLENAVYSVIQENDENQWKNQQQNTESTSKDY